jgi:flagellar hook assembly protein FlgD
MSFDDVAIDATRVWYRIRLDRDGAAALVSPPVEVALRTATGLRLDPIALSPRGRPLAIAFALPASGTRSRLDVFDVRGRRVRNLADRVFAPGSYVFTWDRTDVKGQRVPRGVYFVRLQCAGRQLTRKLVLVGG